MKTIFDELKQEVKNWWVSLILGILYVAVALGLMFFPFNGYAALSILFSISMLVSGLLMFRGFSSVGYAMDLKRYGTKEWGWYTAFGILAIVCSLIILWQPTVGAIYAVYMISFAFLIIGFFRIMLSFELKNLHKQSFRNS